MIKNLLKRLLVRSTEMVFAVVLVVFFFLSFMAIISLSFPQGTSLQELMLNPELVANPRVASTVQLDMADASEPGRVVARLLQTHRIVKNKRSDAITWSNAQSGMPLENRHSIQTYSRAGAKILIGETNELNLGENSLIVVRSLELARHSNRKRASMIVLDGELGVTVEDSAADDMDMEVLTAGGSKLLIPHGARASEFKVRVNPDETSTFAVYNGTAEVTSGGRTVRLGPNTSVTVAQSQAPGAPQALPDRPDAISPGDSSVYAFSSIPPRVRFHWNQARGSEDYRLVISRDPKFEDVVYDKRISGSELVHGNLKAGRYYWKVGGLAGWAEGPGSTPRAFDMVHDRDPPALSVAFPEQPLQDPLVLLKGTAEPGAEVFIGEWSVPTGGTGEFEYAMNLQRGLNVVVVEAVDAAGNISYQSRLVNAKF